MDELDALEHLAGDDGYHAEVSKLKLTSCPHHSQLGQLSLVLSGRNDCRMFRGARARLPMSRVYFSVSVRWR